nr:8150_t:CDS:2 [Entrophospora candida]
MYLHELSHLISHVLSQNSSQKENRRTSIKRLRTEPSLAIKNITNTIPTSITTGTNLKEIRLMKEQISIRLEKNEVDNDNKDFENFLSKVKKKRLPILKRILEICDELLTTDTLATKCHKKIIEFGPLLTDERIKIDFGTGVLKCTPGHDFADYELAKKYQLPLISCCDEKGILNELAGS